MKHLIRLLGEEKSCVLYYHISFVFLYSFVFYSQTVYAQCQRMEYPDSQLNKHSGSYFLYFMPDSYFYYYNKDYQQYHVLRVIHENAKGEGVYVQEYNNSGYLRFELKRDSSGNCESHYYTYLLNNHMVVDSSIHVISKIDPIMLLPVKPARKDTIYHKELRYYDEYNRLTRGYHIFSKEWMNSYLEGKAFYPDSFFYHYDHCGNCDQIIWYSNAVKESKTQDNFVLNGGTMINVVHKDGYGSEVWKYDSTMLLTDIDTDYESIRIEYNSKKQIKRYQYIFKKESYFKHDVEQAILLKETSIYLYDNRSRLNKIGILREYPDKKVNRWYLLERYPNGLLKTDFEGNLIRYNYYK